MTLTTPTSLKLATVLATCLLAPAAHASYREGAPTQALQAAELAISNAEQAHAADFAAPDLSRAREELASARTAAQQDHMRTAEYLALESRAAAELAYARSEAARAEGVNDEMRKGNQALQEEMQRHPGAR